LVLALSSVPGGEGAGLCPGPINSIRTVAGPRIFSFFESVTSSHRRLPPRGTISARMWTPAYAGFRDCESVPSRFRVARRCINAIAHALSIPDHRRRSVSQCARLLPSSPFRRQPRCAVPMPPTTWSPEFRTSTVRRPCRRHARLVRTRQVQDAGGVSGDDANRSFAAPEGLHRHGSPR